MTSLIPLGVGIVNVDEGGRVGWGRVCKSVGGIAAINIVVEQGSKGEEKALYWLFNTRRVRGGNLVEKGCGSR